MIPVGVHIDCEPLFGVIDSLVCKMTRRACKHLMIDRSRSRDEDEDQKLSS